MNRKPLLAVLPALATLGLSACGESTSSTSAAHAAATATAPAAASSSSPAPAAAPTPAATHSPVALITTKREGKLGRIIAFGPKRLTVYLFEADHGGRSACAGACAAAWPPVLGQPHAADGARAAALGTIRRANGTRQVTYDGHPLYRFIKDKDAGDAYGQGLTGFGAGWYVLRPSGAKVDEDSGKRPRSSSSVAASHQRKSSTASRSTTKPSTTKPSTPTHSTSTHPVRTPAAAAPARPSPTAVTIAAAPSGQLAFTQSTVATRAGTVTIRFTNSAPEAHNLTLARAGSGSIVAATPTFQGGARSITVRLAPGTYTFFCSVPGHRMAGMHGTLTVR